MLARQLAPARTGRPNRLSHVSNSESYVDGGCLCVPVKRRSSSPGPWNADQFAHMLLPVPPCGQSTSMLYPVRAEKDMTCMMELLVVARYIKIKINKAQLINPTRPEKMQKNSC